MSSEETIYFSAPLHVHGTERYAAALRTICETFPHSDVFEPCKAFENHAQWSTSWRTFLEMSDRLMFVTDEEGWIGRGSVAEISGAKEMGLEVKMVTGKRFVPLTDLRPVEHGENDWKRHLRITVKS